MTHFGPVKGMMRPHGNEIQYYDGEKWLTLKSGIAGVEPYILIVDDPLAITKPEINGWFESIWAKRASSGAKAINIQSRIHDQEDDI